MRGEDEAGNDDENLNDGNLNDYDMNDDLYVIVNLFKNKGEGPRGVATDS